MAFSFVVLLSAPICFLVLTFFSESLAAGADGPIRFTIETPAATRAGCTLRGLDEAGLHFDEAGMRDKLPGFLELRREGRSLPPIPTRDFVLLTSGDRIPLDPGAAATLEENRLLIWPAKSSLPGANARGLSLYVPSVTLVFWSLPEGVEDAELFFAQIAKEPRKRDVVYLKNGDRVEGTMVSMGARTGSVMTVGAKRVETPWSKLAGVAWNSERALRLATKKPYARAVLDGGARISFTDLGFDGKTRTWKGKTLFGAPLEFNEENLLAIDMRQALAVQLSELMPAHYEQRPYLGAAWPLARDTTSTGQALRLGGSTYEKGLGMHAPCRVAYKLDGKFQRFDALVGIDELARRGRARVALDLDGKRIDLNDGKELSAKDAPVLLRQDVRGVRELTLIVELGSFGDVQANINWAKARLIKKE